MKTKRKDKAKKENPTKRSKSKYPNLDPKLNIKIRQDLFECDYLDQLSDKEKAWLDQFNGEYINASFNSKNPKKNLHKTKDQRKACYDANNARNRDVLSRAKAQGKSLYLEELVTSEDELNEKLEQAFSLSKSGKDSGSDSNDF